MNYIFLFFFSTCTITHICTVWRVHYITKHCKTHFVLTLSQPKVNFTNPTHLLRKPDLSNKTFQMKALDEYFLMVVFTLLLSRVHVFCSSMFNLDRETGQWKGSVQEQPLDVSPPSIFFGGCGTLLWLCVWQDGSKMENMGQILLVDEALSSNAFHACVYIYIQQLRSFRAPMLWFINLTVPTCLVQYIFLSLCQFFYEKTNKTWKYSSPPFSYLQTVITVGAAH